MRLYTTALILASVAPAAAQTIVSPAHFTAAEGDSKSSSGTEFLL